MRELDDYSLIGQITAGIMGLVLVGRSAWNRMLGVSNRQLSQRLGNVELQIQDLRTELAEFRGQFTGFLEERKFHHGDD